MVVLATLAGCAGQTTDDTDENDDASNRDGVGEDQSARYVATAGTGGNMGPPPAGGFYPVGGAVAGAGGSGYVGTVVGAGGVGDGQGGATSTPGDTPEATGADAGVAASSSTPGEPL